MVTLNRRRTLLLSALTATLFSLAASPPLAAAHRHGPSACLSREERREVIGAGKVTSLATAIRAAHTRYRGDVLRARLCRSGPGYVYLLTVLARNGKVARVSVDAVTGRLVDAR